MNSRPESYWLLYRSTKIWREVRETNIYIDGLEEECEEELQSRDMLMLLIDLQEKSREKYAAKSGEEKLDLKSIWSVFNSLPETSRAGYIVEWGKKYGDESRLQGILNRLSTLPASSIPEYIEELEREYEEEIQKKVF